MKLEFKKAISFIEVAFIIFVLFFIYTFVIKQMLNDMKFSDLKRSAATAYTRINNTTRNLTTLETFENRFRNEYDVIYTYGKELKAEKICNNAQKDGCWSSNWIWADLQKPGLKLASGEYVISELSSPACINNLNTQNTCGALYIDTNGPKAPNAIGHDIIKLYLTKKAIIPAGLKGDIINPPKTCDMTRKFGWACTARLLGLK